MAIGKERSSSSVFLDISSAQAALDKLNRKIDEYDRLLKKTNLTQKEIASLQKSRADTAQKSASIQQQIEKGIGATLQQQKKYVQDLRKEMELLAVGTQEFADKEKQLNAAVDTLSAMKQRLNEVATAQNETTKATGFWRKNLDTIKSFFISGGLLNIAGRIFGGIKDFISDSFNEALEAAEKTDRLKNKLENLGRTDVFDRMIAKAEEMAQRFTYLDNDDVLGVFEHLIDYGKLTEKQMNDLLPVIINFAANQRIAIGEATEQITKFVETGRGLKGFGLNVKDAKTEAERMALVMGDLAKKVTGAGEAFANSSAGGIATTKQEIKDLKEEIGTGLLPVLKDLLSFVNKAIKGLSAFTKSISDAIKGQASIAGSFMLTTLNDNKDVQQEIKTSEEQYLLIHANKIKSLQSLHQEGKKLDKTEKDLMIETINSLTEVQKQADAKVKELSKQTSPNFDELAGVFAKKEAAQKVIDKLQTELTPKQIGTGGETDADESAESKFKSLLQKADEFNKKIRDLQQQSADASLTQNEKEIAEAKHKYDEILIAYRVLVKELEKSGIHLAFNEDDIKKLEDNEITALIEKQRREFLDKQTKDYIATAEKEYQESLKSSATSFESIKEQRTQQFVQGVIDEKQYKSDIAAIDAAAAENQLAIAREYAGKKVTITVDGVQKEVSVVKQADEDVLKFEKDNLQKQTAEILASYAQRKENAKILKDLDKEALLSTLQARISSAQEGSIEEFNAKKELLDAEHRIEVEAIELRRQETIKAIQSQFDAELRILKEQIEVKRKIELALVSDQDPDAEKKRTDINNRFDHASQQAEVESAQRKGETVLKINDDFNALIASANDIFRKKEEESTKEHYERVASSVLEFGQQVLNIFKTIDDRKAQQENEELARQEKNNNKQKNSLQKLLNGKLISQQEYYRRTKQADDEYNKQVAAAKKRQWERQHKADVAQAFIGGAQAVISGLQTKPFLPLGIIMGALAGVLAGIQIANVVKQKTPEFGKGGHLEGPSHSQGGMPVINPRTGKKEAEVEGGEVILSKKTVSKNTEVVKELLHASMHREGELRPFWKNRPYKEINVESISRSIRRVRHFESGGVFLNSESGVASNEPGSQNTGSTLAGQQTVVRTEPQVVAVPIMTDEHVQLFNAVIEELRKPKKNYVLLKDINVEQDILDRIREDAIFKSPS